MKTPLGYGFVEIRKYICIRPSILWKMRYIYKDLLAGLHAQLTSQFVSSASSPTLVQYSRILHFALTSGRVCEESLAIQQSTEDILVCLTTESFIFESGTRLVLCFNGDTVFHSRFSFHSRRVILWMTVSPLVWVIHCAIDISRSLFFT